MYIVYDHFSVNIIIKRVLGLMGACAGEGEGITALAHPSSLFIGSTHGVYVMEHTG
jgi:hypothetical protein